ncbi:DUF5941 domain-containing protein [Nocardiopsis sp. CT-R113]|uniref:DUF5941 domain-containing protein n=1 Tax=Nocardiopsis codii TaxID=3065942 RepID=A0ABU7KFS3_9ACTN|nr:DUF5941 domain-containing protein [Nocardiopsis sp. CT-R113]MEE2041070.1 DUF5941 domain-containing protein [Nocardiopsis sp. CT-R113]
MSANGYGGTRPHPREQRVATTPDLRFLRDDGHTAVLFGRIVQGAVPPLLPALTGALVVGTLLAAERGQLAGITLFAPVAALLLSGLASGHPHDGRFDWLVPPVLRATEYTFLAVLGLASGVPGPLVFVLLVAVVCHHRDDAARPAVGMARPEWVRGAALGWDGRMLVVAVGGALHALTPAYGILAGYLAVLLVREAVRTWSATPVTDVRARTTATPGGGDTDPGDPRISRPGHGDGGQPAAGTNGEA